MCRKFMHAHVDPAKKQYVYLNQANECTAVVSASGNAPCNVFITKIESFPNLLSSTDISILIQLQNYFFREH